MPRSREKSRLSRSAPTTETEPRSKPAPAVGLVDTFDIVRRRFLVGLFISQLVSAHLGVRLEEGADCSEDLLGWHDDANAGVDALIL
jgi:hypothetical protein